MNFNKEKLMSGSGPIHKHDISDTIKVIAGLVEVYPQELMDGLLGSAGKQKVSGDIDLAIEDTLENIVDVLEQNNANFKVNKGLNCVHLLVEIKGPKREIPNYTGKVQADLFFGEKEWLKFSHFSAGDKSKYKGMYRTVLLSSIISATTDFVDYDNGQLIAKVGPILNLGEGIRTQYRIALAKKDGQGYIKKLIEVKADDNTFNDRYGIIKTEHIDINTPADAARFIFRDRVVHKKNIDSKSSRKIITTKDLESFEQVHKLMLECIPIKKQQIIQKIFRNRTGKHLRIAETKISEAEQLDTSTYGSWIFPNGKIDPVSDDGHLEALRTYYQRPDMVKPTDQDKLVDMAFQDGLVRVVHSPKWSDRSGYQTKMSIELHGREKDLRKTFKIWWKSAMSVEIVYIDIQKNLESFKSYKFKMPMEKEKLKQLLGPKSSSRSAVNESQQTQMPWNSDPTIGWWLDSDTITLYHGTHKDRVASILENGLSSPDSGRTADTTFLALEPFTARGYGSMSGEIEFRAAGAKAKHVSMEERATIVFEFPKEYVEQNMIWVNPKLVNRESYEKFVGSDTEYYELAEVQHPGNISTEFIVGYM